MSRAPRVLTDSRADAQLGNSQLADSLVHDRSWNVFNDYHVDTTAENLARKYGTSRQLRDAYALSSQQKAWATINAGRFKNEIVLIITQSNGQALVISTDGQPRTDTGAEALARLNPSFDSLGFMTAGNTSSISDGAAAVMMMNEVKARALNLPMPARIRAFASVGVDPALMGIMSVYATRHCLKRVGRQLVDIDLIETNETFATQALSVDKMSEWDERRVNVSGSAIALGHPVGTSGCRILVSLVYEMVRRNAREGLVTFCIGGGQGVALTIERDE